MINYLEVKEENFSETVKDAQYFKTIFDPTENLKYVRHYLLVISTNGTYQ